ncbi:MAG: CPBP family intramembrane metalloprotease [Propionibacteriaceae bacterium]|nr:CPBP family intramembrane metalloprotease [Propionibacteriaceae bacterium]
MINPAGELRAFVTAALITPVEREHSVTPEELVHRRLICAATLAVGSFMMAWTIRIPPGNPAIYAAILALATTWIVGALLSGKIYLGASHTRRGTQDGRALLQSLVIGLLLTGVFLAGGVVVANVPFLRDPLNVLVAHAQLGNMPVIFGLVAFNAVAEELFFRGGLYAAAGEQHQVLITTLVYALSAVPTGIPLLVFATAVLGTVVGLQRRVTGGVLGPIITHLVWLAGMLFVLPNILALAQ